jgi:predicted RNase H-like nuclease
MQVLGVDGCRGGWIAVVLDDVLDAAAAARTAQRRAEGADVN